MEVVVGKYSLPLNGFFDAVKTLGSRIQEGMHMRQSFHGGACITRTSTMHATDVGIPYLPTLDHV